MFGCNIAREDMARKLTEFYKTGYGAEIGVCYAANALRILQYWEGSIFLIDCWEFEGKQRLETTIKVMEPYRKRSFILPMESLQAVSLLQDNILDWVFIDGDHSYESCYADILHWSKKVRRGGIVGGHDYYMAKKGDPIPDKPEVVYPADVGVKQAVDDFITDNNLVLNLLDINWYFINEK